MYLIIEENPNCAPDERVFSTSGEKRRVKRVNVDNPATRVSEWCEVTAVKAEGGFTAAFAQRVEDSSDGTAWLIFGEDWGLRFKPSSAATPWSIDDKTQWGKPFLVLDSSGSAIEFE